MKMKTIYIAPGNSQCRVYAIPYAMRPGQSPRDIGYKYQREWSKIGLLNHNLELVWIDPKYAHLAGEIAGQMGGTFFGA